MAALGEQQPHLIAGDGITDLEAVDTCKAAADPATRRLTSSLVVAGQIRPAPMRCVMGGHLTDQIVIAMTGRQLVQAHRHNPHMALSCRPAVTSPTPPCKGCVRFRLFESLRWLRMGLADDV